MKTLFFTCMVTLFSITYLSAQTTGLQNIEQELSKDELAKLSSRELILKTKDLPGQPWPEITFYALVNASPIESIGIFAAYDLQKDYVPNMIKSQPIKHVSATDVHTLYEFHMPFPLSNAHYIHGARLYKYQNDYELHWYMVESTSAENVKGIAYFTSYQGKTLFKYQSFIVPKSIFGSLVKKTMLKDVRQSIKAIVEYIEKNKRENSPHLTKYSEFITRALSGEFVYQTIIDKK